MKIQNHRSVAVAGFAALLLLLAACAPAPGTIELPLGHYRGYTNSIQPAAYWYVGASGERLRISATDENCPDNCLEFKITIHTGEHPTGPVVASGVRIVQAELPQSGNSRYTIVIEPQNHLVLDIPGAPFDLRLSNY